MRIYRPFPYSYQSIRINKYNHLKCSSEITILGSQTIIELMDKIKCANDYVLGAELKNLKDEKKLLAKVPKVKIILLTL